MYFKSKKLFVIKIISSVMYHGIKIIIFIKTLKLLLIRDKSRALAVSRMEKSDNICHKKRHVRICRGPRYASVYTCRIFKICFLNNMYS